jgi:predicted hydrolase (HD superfamily)
MTRDEAYALLKAKVKTTNLVKHCLAVEACMRAVAAEMDDYGIIRTVARYY